MPAGLRLPAPVVALLLAACPRAAPPAVPDAGPPLPPALAFAGTETTLLFSFVDPNGTVRSVDKLADVPGSQRRNVMVVDLSRTPEERQADRYVYFVDVSAPGPDGKFHANVVSRYQAALGGAAGEPQVGGAAEGAGVVVYSASWCGFCKKVKSFLKQRRVPFTERDVEKDPGADAELQRKARAAGVRVSGVPVTDFMGELVMGFDQARLEELVNRSRAAAPTGPSASP